MLRKNRNLLWLILMFALPVLLAKLALEFDWFNRASTNKGELLTPALDFSLLNPATDQPRWRLLYLLPEACDQRCNNALYSMQQVWLALGRESDRLVATAVATNGSADVTPLSNLYPQMQWLKVEQSKLEQVFGAGNSDGIFIVDTLQNVILHYPMSEQKQQAVMQSRDILADVRKLLKLSRIG